MVFSNSDTSANESTHAPITIQFYSIGLEQKFKTTTACQGGEKRSATPLGSLSSWTPIIIPYRRPLLVIHALLRPGWTIITIGRLLTWRALPWTAGWPLVPALRRYVASRGILCWRVCLRASCLVDRGVGRIVRAGIVMDLRGCLKC
jgi:hypothetical protein